MDKIFFARTALLATYIIGKHNDFNNIAMNSIQSNVRRLDWTASERFLITQIRYNIHVTANGRHYSSQSHIAPQPVRWPTRIWKTIHRTKSNSIRHATEHGFRLIWFRVNKRLGQLKLESILRTAIFGRTGAFTKERNRDREHFSYGSLGTTNSKPFELDKIYSDKFQLCAAGWKLPKFRV